MLKGVELSSRKALLVGGAVLLAALVLWAALTEPTAKGSPSGDVVVVVDGTEIKRAEVDQAISQAAKRQNRDTPPKPGTPEYKAITGQALNDVLDLY